MIWIVSTVWSVENAFRLYGTLKCLYESKWNILHDNASQIFNYWHLTLRFIEERPVVFYCDFHSHSRKHNIFLYGCENKEANECVLLEQVFPLMMHRASKGMVRLCWLISWRNSHLMLTFQFEFENCKFVIQRAKEGTGRVVMKQLGILHSYTLEASVCGTLIGTNSTQVQTHFNIADLKEMGEIFCQTLAEFFDQSPSRVSLQRLWLLLGSKGSKGSV